MGEFYHWLGASADAETGSHPSGQAPTGLVGSRFDPARWFIVEVGEDGRAIFRHAHRNQCDCPICKEFDSGFEEGRKEGLKEAHDLVSRALRA